MYNMRLLYYVFLLGIFHTGLLVEARGESSPAAKQVSGEVQFQPVKELLKRIGFPENMTVVFSALPKVNQCDQFETSVKDNTLYVKASSPASAARAVYDYLRRNGYAFVSWAGTRMELPDVLPDQEARLVVSPFNLRSHLNTCDFGYSMPYWDWARWEKELDWMALRGINMPLALVGTEPIMRRVWKKYGLTEEESAAFFTAPAHLPWNRMGNIANMGGPIPAEWYDQQLELQHKIMNRMKELGMEPICPAFSGFIPRGFKRLFPELKMHLAGWINRPEWARPMLLSPEEPLFFEIGKTFTEEWEKEFGRGKYYLGDMFNEQELPIGKDDPGYYDFIVRCGEMGYKAVSVGNPDAIWVMQGWILNYQRGIWDFKTVEAFMRNIPKDKYIIIDLGTDWNTHVWKNKTSFEVYKGFFGKNWMYSVVPNMGGKSLHTGDLDYYAQGHVKALESEYKDTLVGMGNATEAIETQEILQELFFDATWSDKATDVQAWMENYAKCRYGSCPPEIKEAFALLRESVYGRFKGSLTHSWQFFNPRRAFTNADEKYFQAIELFAKAAPALKDEPLYRADLLELCAMYLGAKMQFTSATIMDSVQLANADAAEKAFEEFTKLGQQAGSMLNQHPYMNLRTWCEHARSQGTTREIKDFYEEDARTLIGTWGTRGTALDDYAGKFWGGMIETFYIPRWRLWLDMELGKKPKSDRRELDFAWTKDYAAGTAAPAKMTPDEIVALCTQSLELAKAVKKPADVEIPVLGNWSPANVSEEWKQVEWTLTQEQLARLSGVRFKFTKGSHRLEIRKVQVEADGSIVAEKSQLGKASNQAENNMFALKIPKEARGNNSCSVRAEVRAVGGTKSYGNVEMILKNEKKSAK